MFPSASRPSDLNSSVLILLEPQLASTALIFNNVPLNDKVKKPMYYLYCNYSIFNQNFILYKKFMNMYSLGGTFTIILKVSTLLFAVVDTVPQS